MQSINQSGKLLEIFSYHYQQYLQQGLCNHHVKSGRGNIGKTTAAKENFPKSISVNSLDLHKEVKSCCMNEESPAKEPTAWNKIDTHPLR